MERSIKDYVLIGLKGMGMGAADAVPGVSGGTIAFISGIYDELLNSINGVTWGNVSKLWKEGFLAAWKALNGSFLLALLTGIGLSIVTAGKILKFTLADFPIETWSLFFGLIVAAVWLMGKTIKTWNLMTVVSGVIGIAIAYYITITTPAQASTELWMVFLSGALAICAMILPGISGSFILVLLGMYQFLLTDTIPNMNLAVIATFGAGCVVGLLSFSRVVSWLLKKYPNVSISLLTGFMIGSLNKIWPWKNCRADLPGNCEEEAGHQVTQSVLPGTFDGDPHMISAIALMIVGLAFIIALERWGSKKGMA